MTKKDRNILFAICLGFFFGIVFGFNVYTFFGIKNNTGYAYGTIIENFESGRHRDKYSRYEYSVNGIKYQGRQGDKFALGSLVVIVFDKENPKFSMIAKYPLNLISKNDSINEINSEFVTYSWLDYLPGDDISDLWR